jgi:hypothetical protein
MAINEGKTVFCRFETIVYQYGPVLRIRIQDEQPVSYFREIKKQFELKHLNSLMWIQEGQISDPG